MNNDILEKCKDKVDGKIKIKWEALNTELGFPAPSGDALRKRYAKQCVGTKEGEEERKPVVEDFGDYYMVTSKRHTIKITKDELRKLKEFYCLEQMTINQVCMETELPRDEFFVIKTAFSITKDDVPVLDEDLDDPDAPLRTLQKKKKLFNLKMQQLDISETQKELKAYRTKEFWLDKTNKIAEQFKPIPFNGEVVTINSDNEGVLFLADFHTGMKVDNFWNKYDSSVLKNNTSD